jgi:hypothetical protein
MHIDQRLDGMVARGHFLKQLWELCQRTFAVHKIARVDDARLDGSQRLPDGPACDENSPAA